MLGETRLVTTGGTRIIWRNLPTEVNWVVQDWNGEMWGCRDEPRHGEKGWDVEDSARRLLRCGEECDDNACAVRVDDWQTLKWKRPT